MKVRQYRAVGARGAAVASIALGLIAFGAACSSSSDSTTSSSSSSSSATTEAAPATTTQHVGPPPTTTTNAVVTTTTAEYDKSGQPCVATGGVPGYWVHSGSQWICKVNTDVPTAPTSILTGVTPPTSILTGVTPPPSNLTGVNPPN